MSNNKKSISIIGGGAAALSLASFLDGRKYDVTIYERNKALGRKFLVAGKGGFNLTHSERISMMTKRYQPAGFLDEVLRNFDNIRFREWLERINIETYVGSSRRVFPIAGIKPIEVLDKIKEVILSGGHQVKFNSKWEGWSDSSIVFDDGSKVNSDITIFCLGGCSWKITGSDGAWSDLFSREGITVNKFLPANCAYKVDWDPSFISKASGKPIKNIAISCDNYRIEGEALITDFGLEGSGIYALTDPVQNQLSMNGFAMVFLDLKPMLSFSDVKSRLLNSQKKVTEALSKDLKLEKVKVQMLKSILTKEQFLDMDSLASHVKSLPIQLDHAAHIDEAISTTGGIAISEIDSNFQLNQMPNTYALGEMLDWNAPTGGYLLQACFSMGYHLANHLNKIA